jgi:class 3 adenylate cyclase
MSAVRNWLEEIGLAQYADAFEANDIDTDLLTQIDDQVLKDIGVSSAGHRLRLRNAIAKLAPTSIAEGISEVPASPPPSQAERRQLTVMFCDLVGSTALSVRFDPEELREEIRAYQNTVFAVVARYDGFVAKYMGDGVLAYFGYPRAHEDDTERAVRAGLEIEAAVTRLETRGTERLAIRIGIATGLVVVGDLVGEGSAQEQAVVGETPNLAARLQALAEPRQIVLAGATRRLIGDLFRLRDLGRQTVKGFVTPVEAFAVEGAAVTESRSRRRAAGSPTSSGGRMSAPCCATACAKPGPAPARSSCSRARPALASHGSALSSRPRSRASRTRGCAINARPITATASCTPLSCDWGAPPASPPRIRPRRSSTSSKRYWRRRAARKRHRSSLPCCRLQRETAIRRSR